jgi:hypothetical protein
VGYEGGNAGGWRRIEELSFISGFYEPGKRFGNGGSGVSGSGIIQRNAGVDEDWILEQ